MEQVIAKMRDADVIVLATPVYFYSMCAQMKTMIDRTLGGAQISGLENKKFYLIATAADGYDVIFLGFPNWNADLPMPLYTFLEEYDFSGKTIIPFTTHGGSGFSRTIQTIQELQPDANVISDGLSISRNSVAGAESEVVDWVNGLNLSK